MYKSLCHKTKLKGIDNHRVEDIENHEMIVVEFEIISLLA